MKSFFIFLLLFCLLLALGCLNLLVGSVQIPVGGVVDALTGRLDAGVWRTIVVDTRLPQMMTAMVCGAGLSVAGLQLQTLFHNPLAGPSVLGISSAASLGVALVVLPLSAWQGMGVLSRFGVSHNVLISLAAVAGSVCVLMLLLRLAHRVESGVTLLVVGVMIGYVASAVVGVLKFFSSEEDVHAYVIWGLGSFSRVTGGQAGLFAGIMAVLLPLSLLLAKWLNMLLLGEQYALSLGLNIRRARTMVVCSSGILTAVCTAYCGPVMFIGLSVPHIVRGMFGTEDHRLLLPATLLGGANLALLCNLVARIPLFDGSLPVNSVTALIGAPVALWVLLRKRK